MPESHTYEIMTLSKNITFELLYRAGYGVALLGLLISHDYLSFGFQSEYFEGLCLKTCQDCSFCFETNLDHAVKSLHHVRACPPVDALCPMSITTLSHQSSSWYSLSLASLSYFYPIIIQALDVYHKFKYFLILSVYSHCTWVAFYRPGLLGYQGHMPAGLLQGHILMALLLLSGLHSYILVIQESYIETLDSELLIL